MAMKRMLLLLPLVLISLWLVLGRPSLWALWRTADQQGAWYYQQQEYLQATAYFRDQGWRAAALYGAGEYERAAELFARQRDAEGYYNQGNALAQLELYKLAADAYQKALALQPGWSSALNNLELVKVMARKPQEEGDRTAGEKARLEADGLVFDLKNKTPEASEEQVLSDGNGLTREQIKQQWLRRLSVDPADFLRRKFAYQQHLNNPGDNND